MAGAMSRMDSAAHEREATQVMINPAAFVFRRVFSGVVTCARCGSKDVFPAPGPFGALGFVIGVARHHCRPCGRPFWTKASAEYRYSEDVEPKALLEDSGEFQELPESPAPESAGDVALDGDLSHPERERVDLTALDAQFARRCALDEELPRSHRR